MGRMFDALARGKQLLNEIPETPNNPSSSSLTLLETESIEAIEGEALPPDNDTVPYIEVGGKVTKTSPVAPASVNVVNTAQIVSPVSPEVNPVTNPSVSSVRVTAVPEIRPEASVKKADFPRLAETTPFISVQFFSVPDIQAPASNQHPFSADLVAYHQPNHPLTHQYRALLRQAVSHLPPDQKGVLLFTSIAPQTGTTSTVLNLAILRAKEYGKRVLVIDGNPGRPDLSLRLGVASRPGLHDLLHRTLPISLSIQRTAQANLSALPAGHGEAAHGQMDPNRLAVVIDQLRQRYDWILIDGASWGEDSLISWVPLSQSVYLLMREQDSDSAKVDVAHEGILNMGGCLRGYVTTR